MEQKKQHKFNRLLGIPIIILLTVLLEVFVFNFKYFASMNYNEIGSEQFAYTMENCQANDNIYSKLQDGSTPLLVAGDIHAKVKNIYVDVTIADYLELPIVESGVVSVEAYYKEENSEEFIAAGSHKIDINHKNTFFIPINSKNAVDNLVLELKPISGHSFIIQDIALNKSYDFSVNWLRVGILFALGMLVYILLPGSFVWKTNCETEKWWKKLFVYGTLIGVTTLLFFIMDHNQQFIMKDYNAVYKQISHILLEHDEHTHVHADESEEEHFEEHLDAESVDVVENNIKNDVVVQNAADGQETEELNETSHIHSEESELEDECTGEEELMEGAEDYGFIPWFFLNFPMYSALGLSLPFTITLCFLALFLMIGIYFLLKKIIKDYFPSANYAELLLLFWTTIMGLGVLFIGNMADETMVPIYMGIGLLIWGYYFVLNGKKKCKGQCAYLVIGSICLGLLWGCRPILGLYIIPLVILLIEETRNNKKERKKILLTTVIPYVLSLALSVIGQFWVFGKMPGMRFTYTIVESAKSNNVLVNIFKSVYYYLLKPLEATDVFPYFTYTFADGQTQTGLMNGGLLLCNLILLFVAALYTYRNGLNDKKLKTFCVGLVSVWIALFLLDASICGISYLYRAEIGFGLFLMMDIAVLLFLRQTRTEKMESLMKYLIFALCLISIVLNAAQIFFDNPVYPMRVGDSKLYYDILHLFSV